MEAVATPGECPDLSDACLVDILQMAPTADVLEILRDEDPERKFGAKAQAALLRCLRHPVAVAHPPGRPYRERLLKLAALAAEHDGLVVDDALAEAHAEALCEPRAGDQWDHKTFVLDFRPRDVVSETSFAATDASALRDAGSTTTPRVLVSPREHTPEAPLVITARTHSNLFEGSTGCHEWAAGFALAELVVSHPSRFAGKRVVEIGPGVGVASSALAKSPHSPLEALTLLDRDHETLANLAANLAINGVPISTPETGENELAPDPRGAAAPTPRTRATRVALRRLDWHDFDPTRLRAIRAEIVVAADVLYDPTDVSALLDVTAALLGARREERATLRGGGDGDVETFSESRATDEQGVPDDEAFALFVSAVRQPATLALFARLAAERGFEPADVTETFAAVPGAGFRRLSKARRAEMRVHALRPPKARR